MIRWAGFALAAGCALGWYVLPPGVLPWAAVFLLALGGTALAIRRFRRWGVLVLACALGIGWMAGYNTLFRVPVWEQDGQTLTLTVTALEDAHPSPYGKQVRVRWDRGSAMLYLGADGDGILAGDAVTATVLVTRVEDKAGYAAKLSAREEALVTRPERLPLRFWPRAWSRAVSARLDEILPGRTAALVRALILGDRSGLSEKDADALSESGLAHVAAVSGLHVSTLVGFVLLVTRRRRRLSLLALPVIVAFVLLAGAPSSAVRAGVMQAFLLLAAALGRDEDSLWALQIALAGLLLVNPASISDVGLQLSFASALGLILFAGKLRAWLMGKLPGESAAARKAGGILASSLSATLAALLFSTPIAALSFGKVSIIAPLSNLLCLWAVAVLFVGGMVLLGVSLLYLPLARLLGQGLAVVGDYFTGVVNGLARVPFASVYSEQGLVALWLVLAYVLLLVFLLWRKERMRPWVLASLLGGTLTAVLFCLSLGVGTAPLEIAVLDVGQGQCVLVTSGDRAAVIDCGSHTANAARIASDALRARGLTEVEYLILTHDACPRGSRVRGRGAGGTVSRPREACAGGDAYSTAPGGPLLFRCGRCDKASAGERGLVSAAPAGRGR